MDLCPPRMTQLLSLWNQNNCDYLYQNLTVSHLLLSPHRRKEWHLILTWFLATHFLACPTPPSAHDFLCCMWSWWGCQGIRLGVVDLRWDSMWGAWRGLFSWCRCLKVTHLVILYVLITDSHALVTSPSWLAWHGSLFCLVLCIMNKLLCTYPEEKSCNNLEPGWEHNGDNDEFGWSNLMALVLVIWYATERLIHL